MLDAYEEFVVEYISLLRKANNGDMDALAEYPSVMEKARDCSEKLAEAQGQFSEAQMARFLRIQNKMTNAALELN